jgi:hypothetical protein
MKSIRLALGARLCPIILPLPRGEGLLGKALGALAAVAVCFATTRLFAQTNDRPADAGSESIGGQLLEDLKPVGAMPNSANGAAGAQPGVEIDPRLRFRPPVKFDDLGEDVGALDGPLPLVRARQGMQQAGAMLAEQGELASVQATQRQVVSQLDELINQLCKQCQGGNCPPGQQPKTGQMKAGGQASPKPGTPSVGQNNPAAEPPRPAADAADATARDEMVKRLWGHLPERTRDQMRQSFSNEFLPKYELELEKYYRRLGEENE